MALSKSVLCRRKEIVFVEIVKELIDDNPFKDLGECRQNRYRPVGGWVLSVLPPALEDRYDDCVLEQRRVSPRPYAGVYQKVDKRSKLVTVLFPKGARQAVDANGLCQPHRTDCLLGGGDSHAVELKGGRVVCDVLDKIAGFSHGLSTLRGCLDTADEVVYLLYEELVARLCTLVVFIAVCIRSRRTSLTHLFLSIL